jgi:hypothetical protein
VYLTPSFVMPRRDLAEAQAELYARGRPPGRFCWLSWRALDRLESADPVFADMRRLLDRLDLRGFHGVRSAGEPVATWTFTPARWRMECVPPTTGSAWRFDPHHGRSWKWSAPQSDPSWRFST